MKIVEYPNHKGTKWLEVSKDEAWEIVEILLKQIKEEEPKISIVVDYGEDEIQEKPLT